MTAPVVPMTDLACPDCEDTASLKTIEQLTGLADLHAVRVSPTGAVDVDFAGGTTVDWDSSTTVGIRCECGFRYVGPDWTAKLVRSA